jgi:AmiR/NasT family two-component response regulator
MQVNDTGHCYSVLLVSSSAKFNASLLGLLPGSRYHPITIASDVAKARRHLLENRFDIVLINTPLPDDFGTRLALDLCTDSGTGVLLLVKAEHYPDINARVSPYGVLAMSKPISAQMLLQSLVLLCGTRERLRRMEQKTASIEEKMEEIRIVNRAKWLLIEQLKMTEKEAHRYIEKQAMDRCVTRRVIAENIITTYK